MDRIGQIAKSMCRQATRPIQIDRKIAIGSIVVLINHLRELPDQPLKDSLAFRDLISLKAMDGSEFGVQIQYRSKNNPSSPHMVLGGGSGKTTTNKQPAIIILLNGTYTPEVYYTSTSGDRFKDEVIEVLMHELTHQADIFTKFRGQTSQRILTDKEMDLKEYYNKPLEVRGYMRSVYEQVLAYLPKIYPHFTINEIMKRLAFWSPIWKQVSEYMTEDNKKLVMKGVARSVQDWMDEQVITEGDSVRTSCIANRIASRGSISRIRVAAGCMEDCVSVIGGRAEEIRLSGDISCVELEGALLALASEQDKNGDSEELEKIASEIHCLRAEVGNLNQIRRKMALKLAGIEREAELIQDKLMKS